MRDPHGLKVCFLAGSLGQGGAERQLYYILKAAGSIGVEARVLSLTQGEYWESRIKSLGIPVQWIGQRRHPIRRLLKITGELQRNRANIVQSQHFFANGYAVAAARLLGSREIGAIRGDAFEEMESNPGLLGKLSLFLPRTLAVNSSVAMANAVTLGVEPDRLFFLPNVVDSGLFRPERSQPKSTVTILVAGSLVPVKRLDRCLRAIASLPVDSALAVETLVVGDGPMRASLEALARQLGLSPPRLEFCGSADEMTSWFRRADILLLTSDREGTPNVILEAMASEIPVIATRVGGVEALVRHNETGLLVDRDDEAGLSQAILDLVLSAEKRRKFGRAGRDFVEAHHSPAKLENALRTLYDQILSPRGASAEGLTANSSRSTTI
jgi:glycosyltransferase involved in cell wall biosynthesis